MGAGVGALDNRAIDPAGGGLQLRGLDPLILTYIAKLRYKESMKWSVETLDARVDAELESLDPSLKARFLHICELLETFGPGDVGLPHVRFLVGKLWEIRMKGESGIARAIYVTVADQRIVVVHAFVKKTQKTPRRAIKTALDRAKEIRK